MKEFEKKIRGEGLTAKMELKVGTSWGYTDCLRIRSVLVPISIDETNAKKRIFTYYSHF